jgi:predicted DNA-binding protein
MPQTTNNEEDQVGRVTVEIPLEMKRKFKIFCAVKNTTQTIYLTEAIEAAVDTLNKR